MDKEQNTTHINMRYPQDVIESLRRFAQEDERSLHNLIIWILRQYIKQREQGEK